MQQAAYEKYGSVGLVTLGMDRNETIVFCQLIGQQFASAAAAETDHAIRASRFRDVWRFEQRIAKPAQDAEQSLGPDELGGARVKSRQAANIMSMMPDFLLFSEHELKGQDSVSLLFNFFKTAAARCHQIMDDMGIARVAGEPSADYIADKASFRFRGVGFANVFAGTGLISYAETMCRGSEVAEFSGAPLEERGQEGMSLLDWAIECDDKVSFDALIAAGADLNAVGLWDNPPLVNSASAKKIWFLRRLLDAGVDPNAMGKNETALKVAYRDLEASNAGDMSQAAYNLLRERGASLNFPDYSHSMWYQWSFRFHTEILENWDEFDSDPVELASDVEFALEEGWAGEQHSPAGREVIRRLSAEYGVCFPVERKPISEWERDERGYLVQSNCPAED